MRNGIDRSIGPNDDDDTLHSVHEGDNTRVVGMYSYGRVGGILSKLDVLVDRRWDGMG